ncbi:Formate hydrogenlyase subunit 6/NADH:ubiquinone oxidoreductase subunit (chain I) [Caloramator quimbayensis]|uniref:Formate hydrogenlyase subunit 6/NADH:ubiquinone oxidoreductase subunit (Chain I) n=1 Tax=Caloramator quimbayensis TaxID=1147123 RepID=A0A1T4X2G7_9CLOT|nr:4Fe-4S binding protein [Caloramator quimbayensis]SKA83348.1 Formate hydrogenlyase subunit 6/NADH:ubiquinone oxidoreductase subunit (chain I) [Caloramator quimbayensis]
MNFPFVKEAVNSLFKKPSTERYPFVKKEAPLGYRGRILFKSDKCIGCGMCIRVCAPGAITKSTKKTDDGEEITMNFFMGRCTFCQMCADFCPRGAIELTNEFSMITEDKSNLNVSGTFIKKLPPKQQAGSQTISKQV